MYSIISIKYSYFIQVQLLQLLSGVLSLTQINSPQISCPIVIHGVGMAMNIEDHYWQIRVGQLPAPGWIFTALS